MSNIITLTVQAKLGPGVRVESTLGKHVLYVDQPESSGGTDAGPTPPEYFFLSLAGCIGSLARTMANRKGIALRSFVLTIQGDLDLDAILGDKGEGRSGFNHIKMHADLDADLTPEEKREFLRDLESRCPISDTIRRATPLIITIQ